MAGMEATGLCYEGYGMCYEGDDNLRTHLPVDTLTHTMSQFSDGAAGV